jgi:hypothetical protein
MENRCANYDKEFECCRILSDWSEAMPVLQPCVESPCKYFKPYTNYDRIKSMNVDEMADFFEGHFDCNFCPESERLEDSPLLKGEKSDEKCTYHIKQWLLQEVSENE